MKLFLSKAALKQLGTTISITAIRIIRQLLDELEKQLEAELNGSSPPEEQEDTGTAIV